MDDLISRQAVMNTFKKWQPYMATRIHDFEDELRNLPSVDKSTGEWIPIAFRSMTEEEKLQHKSWHNKTKILDCPLPDDEQDVLITVNGYVWIDTFVSDGDECYFECYDMNNVTAWMPLPEPYKAETEVKNG